MADITPRLGLAQPAGGDYRSTLGVGPEPIRDAIGALDAAVMFGASTHAARPAPALAGRLWLSTDTGQVALDAGTAWVELARTSVASTPPGTLIDYAGGVAPSGWLMCDGAAVSRTTYAALFAVIGTGYGSGDGTSTFNVPDLRGRVAVGAGAGPGLTPRGLGATFGTETHQLTAGQSGTPGHTHPISDPGHTHSLDNAGAHTHGASGLTVSSVGAHEHGPGTLRTANSGHHNHGYWRIYAGALKEYAAGVLTLSPLGATALEATEMGGDHNHPLASGATDLGGAHGHTLAGNTASAGTHTHSAQPAFTGLTAAASAAAGAAEAHPNMQPALAVTKLIKT